MPQPNKSFRWLSLFSGAGFHDHGFRMAGHQIVGQIEWDEFCQAVLQKNFGDLPRWRDVRDASVESIRERCGRIDGITGGFSCKNISVAGKQAGITRDTESGITWRNMFRIIRGLRPTWLVIENVPALRTVAADRVLNALERIGYSCWPVVVGAKHLGAPHKRHRVWIIGRFVGNSNGGDMRGRCAEPNEGAAGFADRFVQAGMDELAALADPQHDGRGQQEPGRESEGGIAAGGTGESGDSDGRLADTDSERVGNEDELRRQRGASGAATPDACGRGEAHRCIFPGGCWRCGPIVADAGGEGLEERRDGTGGAGQELAMPAGGSGLRWPARPGEPQHEWEAPRLSQSSVGCPTPVDAGGLVGHITALTGWDDAEAQKWWTRNRVRIEARQRKEGLKAAGNANPPWVPYLIAKWIESVEAA